MVVTIARWVLRVSALLALILGVLNWDGNAADALVNVHMTLGILVTLSLWVLGFMFGSAKGGNWGLASIAIIWGLLVVGLGASQLSYPPSLLVKIIHLLLGVLAIGVGEVVAARYKRLSIAPTQTM